VLIDAACAIGGLTPLRLDRSRQKLLEHRLAAVVEDAGGRSLDDV
jgi:hypothetical protein